MEERNIKTRQTKTPRHKKATREKKTKKMMKRSEKQRAHRQEKEETRPWDTPTATRELETPSSRRTWETPSSTRTWETPTATRELETPSSTRPFYFPTSSIKSFSMTALFPFLLTSSFPICLSLFSSTPSPTHSPSSSSKHALTVSPAFCCPKPSPSHPSLSPTYSAFVLTLVSTRLLLSSFASSLPFMSTAFNEYCPYSSIHSIGCECYVVSQTNSTPSSPTLLSLPPSPSSAVVY